jgi:hypothetical protein
MKGQHPRPAAMRWRARVAGAAAVGLVAAGLALAPHGAAVADGADPAVVGSFAAAVVEPTIGGVTSDKNCVPDPERPGETVCKPAAVSTNVLPGDKVMYYNGLEGLERFADVGLDTALPSGGANVPNDKSRLLDLSGKLPMWTTPGHADGSANPKGDPWFNPLLPGLATKEPFNDGAMFCSDNNILADGRVISAGGTAYYIEPGVSNPLLPGGGLGVIELQGLHATRLYDPPTNDWHQVGDMARGRWYPTMVELPDGKELVAGGVGKLIKPVYPDHPLESGTNTLQTETFDPRTGRWTDNGNSAKKSLPLFPRLHMLPNGHIFYNAEGQSFNPLGQGVDEALWVISSSYDPAAKKWTDLGIAGGGVTPLLGFRGSSFSVMLPLRPDSNGSYNKASILSAGGIIGNPSPGTYLPVADSTITTVDTSGGKEEMSTKQSGPLNRPRWFSSGVLLPTGDVLALAGADKDEVVVPGLEKAIKQAELWNNRTGKWSNVATAGHERTYHNSAVLLADGSVLLGGHSPISTAYGEGDLSKMLGTASPLRDPSFEIYSPPYMHWGGRPSIKSAPATVGYGDSFTIAAGEDTGDIEKVVLVKNPSVTHLTDADQRSVELPILSRAGSTLTVKAPPSGKVAPPGAYMLFINRNSDRGLVPSVARTVWMTLGDDPALKITKVKAKGRTLTVTGSLDRKATLNPVLSFVRKAGKVATQLTAAKRDENGKFTATLTVKSKTRLAKGGKVTATYPGEGYFRHAAVGKRLKAVKAKKKKSATAKKAAG